MGKSAGNKQMRLPWLLVLLAMTLPAAAQEQCVLYDPETVTLTGKVIELRAYGAPGYGETPGRDTIEQYEALLLDVPLCVLQRSADDVDSTERNVTSVQLVFTEAPYRSGFAGRHARMTGKLFHQITGHHHTIVLIEVAKVER